MNVYIGTSGELKNAYIGEVYEYSYDFRNKSIAICQNDGWTFSTTSGITFNSNGITGNSTFGTITRALNTSALANAKKVTFVIDQFKNDNTSSNRGLDLVTSSNTLASGSKADFTTIVTRINGTEIYRGNYTIAIGEYKVTTIIDLENKKISINYPGVVSREDSITDAQIAVVRTLTNLRIQQDTSTIKSISVKIE